MWKWVILVVTILLLAGAGGFLWMMQGPDVSKFEFLKDPRIVVKPDTAVLEVPFQVNSAGLPKVFGALMKTYFKLSGVPKGPGMSAPAARYETLQDFSAPAGANAQAMANMIWKGSAAIPVPATVRELPQGTPEFTPCLSVWKYGEVAEILHVGPYSDEPPTVKKLT
ncbi:MAG: hypothetical protein HGA76_10930, partial [Candidatus Firestonebacteria bacterium]|nr:hypothetical protein [Candidatus Firestonebacteria bacterium]